VRVLAVAQRLRQRPGKGAAARRGSYPSACRAIQVDTAAS
jgi:hypothetical protein